MCGLAEKSVHACGNHNGLDLSLLACGARVDVVAGVLGDRKALAGESRLVNLEWVALQQPCIGRRA